jgi:hypothetical protein
MKVKKKILYCLFSLVLLAEVVGANSQSAAATRRLNKKSLSMKTKGKYQLRLRGVKNTKIKWKSSNKKIATVNNGLVKAKRKGKCIVTAKYLKKKYQCKILVSSDNVKNPNGDSTSSASGNDSNQDTNLFSDEEKAMVYMSAERNSENHLLVVDICNDSSMDISINKYFTLEKLDGENWYPIDLKSGSYFEEVAIMVSAHSHYLQEIDLERYFDTLTKGRYRIKKNFNEAIEYELSAEFVL